MLVLTCATAGISAEAFGQFAPPNPEVFARAEDQQRARLLGKPCAEADEGHACYRYDGRLIRESPCTYHIEPGAIGSQRARVERINAHLQHDGYRLTRSGSISGSALFTIAAHAIGSPADAAISSVLQRFDPEQVHARWTAALDRRAHDPAGAITLARTLLEDVCRWLLDDLGEAASDQDDLPALYRKLAKALKLAPDDHSEQVFKQILGSCQSVVESLGALRNKLGDAHGGGRRRAKPAARHAELAVNLAGSMATFLVATWEARGSVSGARSPSAE